MNTEMAREMAKWSALIYIVWSVAGTLLGTYALIKVGRQWGKITVYLKIGWLFQALMVPLAAIFAIWLSLALMGTVIQLSSGELVFLLILGCILCLPMTQSLLSQPKTKPDESAEKST